MNFSPATKVYLLAGSTDMRMGFDGLFALAKGLLQADPLSGHLFGFCNKGRNRLKILYWDGSGLWICAKLMMLLHGIDPAVTRRRKWHRIENNAIPA